MNKNTRNAQTTREECRSKCVQPRYKNLNSGKNLDDEWDAYFECIKKCNEKTPLTAWEKKEEKEMEKIEEKMKEMDKNYRKKIAEKMNEMDKKYMEKIAEEMKEMDKEEKKEERRRIASRLATFEGGRRKTRNMGTKSRKLRKGRRFTRR